MSALDDYLNSGRSSGRKATSKNSKPQPPEPYPEDQRGDPWEGNGAAPRGREQENGHDPVAVETFTAAQLDAMELPEPKCILKDSIPEGLTVLAGKPKLGKSWWALAVAHAVALGRKALGAIDDVEQGSVLYLALEDTKRRLKSRQAKMLAKMGIKAPDNLTLATAWPKADKGGLYAVAEWLDDHKDARLGIIDTWAKFRPAKTRGRDCYEEDYEHSTQLKALADQFGVGLLAMHHCRKLPADDPVDSVSGTLGLTGAADAVLVLKRERGQHDAALFVTGRDIEEQELAMRWDNTSALWSIMGTADQYRMSRERAEIVEILRRENRPMSPSEIAPLVGKKVGNVKYLLWKLAQENWLKNEEGKYSVLKH
jgi:hypothetical protein